MKFIFFWLVVTFTLFSFTGCGGKRSSSPDNNDGSGTTSSGNTGTDNTGGAPVPPGRHHGSNEVSTGTEQVHIFKYTGRLVCHESGGEDLEEMKSQLTSITVHNKYVSKDGKEYSGDCDTKTGEINVYVIDKANLIKSEKRGFCECTPNPQQNVCIPYKYASPPTSGCN